IDRRSHSATPLRPTSFRSLARSLRRDGSVGFASMSEQRHDIASYQYPIFALVYTLCTEQVNSGGFSTRHLLNSHRSMTPPATISGACEFGSRMTDTYQRYCTSGSRVIPKSLRSIV